jgi:hypothetical protein
MRRDEAINSLIRIRGSLSTKNLKAKNVGFLAGIGGENSSFRKIPRFLKGKKQRDFCHPSRYFYES